MTLQKYTCEKPKNYWIFTCPCCNQQVFLRKDGVIRHLKKYPIKGITVAVDPPAPPPDDRRPR